MCSLAVLSITGEILTSRLHAGFCIMTVDPNVASYFGELMEIGGGNGISSFHIR